MNTSETHSIRPAGRHILTIGSDLIQDHYAAIVELVKNAYDADSPDVSIIFTVSENPSKLKSTSVTSNSDKPESDYVFTIEIRDHGHGMSRDTVINKWLVPSTDDKLKRKFSPKGRVMQGRKGVGRYAASILGSDLLLETVTEDGEKTVVYVQWDDFAESEFLDQVPILVETQLVKQPSGTSLLIKGYDEHVAIWDSKQLEKLRFELKKLIPPTINFGASQETRPDDFSIALSFNDCRVEGETFSEKIVPYPIVELYDYRITGTFDASGIGTFVFSNQKARNVIRLC